MTTKIFELEEGFVLKRLEDISYIIENDGKITFELIGTRMYFADPSENLGYYHDFKSMYDLSKQGKDLRKNINDIGINFTPNNIFEEILNDISANKEIDPEFALRESLGCLGAFYWCKFNGELEDMKEHLVKEIELRKN